MVIKVLWAMVFTIAFFNVLKAQEKTDSSLYDLASDSVFKELNEVVITPEFKRESNVLVPTSEVKQETIEQYSPADLNASINQTPGVYIQSGAYNTNRITIRGIGARTLYGSNKVRAYFNGIPITNGVGETAIDNYNPEDLKSIEIVKGPKATLFGSNLGGTILLHSKEPQEMQRSIQNNTTLGSFGLVKNTTSVNYGDKRLAMHFNYDHLESDGFRDNSRYVRNTYFLTSSYILNENNTVGLLLSQRNYNAQIASSLGQTDFENEPEKAAFTWGNAKGYEDDQQTLVGISLKHTFSTSLTNTISVFYNYNDHYEPRPFNILEENTNGYGLRTVFNKEFSILKRKAEWKIGTEWYGDRYQWKTIENLYQQNNGNGSLEGDLLSNNEELRNQLNVFTTFNFSLSEKVNLQAGLNVNKTNYDYRDNFNTGEENKSNTRSFNPIIAPSLSATYTLKGSNILFANVSRGFNYPGLEQTLNPEGSINPEIGPEKGWNYELGTDLFFINKKLHFNATAYVMDVKDLLVAERVGEDQYIGRNAGRTIHQGIELSAEYQFNISEELAIKPFVNAEFNFHQFKTFVDGGNDYSGNQLTGVPDKKLNAGILIQHNLGLFFNANYLYVGEIPMNDENSLYSNSYEVINAKIGYHFQIKKILQLEVNAGINNISNEKYASAVLINATAFGNNEPRYYYPGLPRNYYGGVSIKLSL